MSYRSSCIIQEFPLSEREHRAPPRRPRRRRRSRLLPVLLALSLVFSFLLGRASAIRPASRHLARNLTHVAVKQSEADVQTAAEQVSDAQPAASVPQEGTPADGELPEEQSAAAPASDTDGTAETPETDRTAWNLLLVNGENPLAEDFKVPELMKLANGHAIDSRAYPALQAMMDAARAEGLRPTICSSFRTWETQERLFRNKIQRLRNAGYGSEAAELEAARWVARPGTSEHQAGLAVDIVDQSYQVLNSRQENTAVQKWLMAHCAEYGFILRYPSDKSEITGIGYEPWHYRYVGVEAAQAIMEQGICLEEYLGVTAQIRS